MVFHIFIGCWVIDVQIMIIFCFSVLFSLVCSDVLARGIDIDNVECVISYDQPRYIRTYIHRVGRTARAGKSGTSITLIQNDKVSSLHLQCVLRLYVRMKLYVHNINNVDFSLFQYIGVIIVELVQHNMHHYIQHNYKLKHLNF